MVALSWLIVICMKVTLVLKTENNEFLLFQNSYKFKSIPLATWWKSSLKVSYILNLQKLKGFCASAFTVQQTKCTVIYCNANSFLLSTHENCLKTKIVSTPVTLYPFTYFDIIHGFMINLEDVLLQKGLGLVPLWCDDLYHILNEIWLLNFNNLQNLKILRHFPWSGRQYLVVGHTLKKAVMEIFLLNLKFFVPNLLLLIEVGTTFV